MGVPLRGGLSATSPRSFLIVGFTLLSLTQLNPNQMNKETIEIAITSALSLMNNEVDNIEFEDLKTEYLTVIEQLETALKELSKNG